MKKRCLMFYPWNLSDASGALALFFSYSRALKAAGYQLDCYAPRGAECDGLFDNVFVSPDPESPLTRNLESAGARWQDPLLPEKMGRNEASMVAAGVLASISNYDVIGIQYTRCHSLKQMLPPGTPVVMFTHDLDSLVGRQEEMIFGTPTEYRLEDEVSRLLPFDLVTVVGPADRIALHSIEPELPIVEAPFTAALEEAVPVRHDSPGVLLWISSAAPFHRFSFFWFWHKVWPRIRSSRPDCSLVIAGRISEAARRLGAAADPQVSVLGVVPDAGRLYREADILLAPYYFGLGIKTKIIEALGKGIPVATTTLGIYNTRLRPGRDAIVSDDASEYADQVIRLISCPALRSEFAQNGREYVRKWHDPQKGLQSFVEAFEKVRLSGKASQKSGATLQRDLYEPLRYLVPWAVQRCREEGARRIAIYGAGSQTRALIPMWQALGGPPIQEIIVTDETADKTFMGFPVVSANRFNPSNADAIVLSSNGYESDMAATCAERWPGKRVYPIWRPLGPAENFEAVCHDRIPGELYENTSSVSV
jgi:hypothetical protein